MSTFTYDTLIKTDQPIEKVKSAVMQSLQRFGGSMTQEYGKICIVDGKKGIPFGFFGHYHSIIDIKTHAEGFVVKTQIDREIKGAFWFSLLLLFTPLFALPLIAISTMLFSNPASVYHRFLKKIKVV